MQNQSISARYISLLLGLSVTYLSFCQFIQIVMLKCSRQNDVIVSEHCNCFGSGFGFSVGYLKMRSVLLEKCIYLAEQALLVLLRCVYLEVILLAYHYLKMRE